MYRITIIALMLIASTSFAQKDLTVEYVDTKTLEYFETQQWEKLIRIGERALENGIESYLLRVRLGIAYYELEKYFGAIPHFEKAVATGYADGVTKEYLYYCYIYTGREEDANEILFDMSPNRREKLRPLINDFINDVKGDAGFSFSNDETKNASIDLDGPDNAYGEQTMNGNQFFFDVGIGQLPLRWFKINYAFTYLNIDRQKQIMFNNERFTDDYKQKQGQLFNEFRFLATHGLVISPSGHYINSKETSMNATYDSLSYRYNSISMGYDSLRFYYTLDDAKVEQDNFVLSLSVFKWFSIFKAGVSGSFSYLNSKHQSQYGASFTVFPLSKPYLYLSSNAVVHNQNSVSNLIFTQSAGGRIIDNLWLEAFTTFGKMNNYNEQNGFIVYNNPDVIKLKYGAELRYYFPFNMSAYFVYAGQNREKKYLTYSLSGYNNNFPVYSPQSITAEYNLNTIVFGLKYDF